LVILGRGERLGRDYVLRDVDSGEAGRLGSSLDTGGVLVKSLDSSDRLRLFVWVFGEGGSACS